MPSRTPTPLFLLAMDHRASLAKDVYGIHGEPTPADIARMKADKMLVFHGLLAAIDAGADSAAAGVLVDERYGEDVARAATKRGVDLAMPMEKSGQPLFTLEFGTLESGEWLTHIKALDPAQVKILVRYNPDFPASDRDGQLAALAQISKTLRAEKRTLMIELLVPATKEQLAKVGGDAKRYDAEIRAGLTARVIADFQAHDVEPEIWKIEGLETTEAAAEVVKAAQAGGRDEVVCIVLGRNAPAERLDHWLKVAAVTKGFIGFAIGRSIWEKPLEDKVAGKITDAELVSTVARNYRHYVDAYRSASRP